VSLEHGPADPNLYFSNHFGVNRKIVEKYGAFDISLVDELAHLLAVQSAFYQTPATTYWSASSGFGFSST
jgi:hypothetical protein